MSNQRDLHESRLATTDEHGRRVYVHPEDIKGPWKNRRTIFYWFLILIYLVLPWIYIDGKQWILLNLPKREFTLFGTMFYAHDGPLLIFIMLGFLFGIAFVTSIWGRLWCGWACPQTVFIDVIYRRIERIVEGNARARKALASSPWTFKKLVLKSTKWLLFLLVSLHIVHSFLGYFVGTHELFWITLQNPAHNYNLFITMLFLTGLVLFDFGWFREQFCIIACPYGRFQSVLMDDSSMIVGYDYNRGEPRRNIGIVPKDKEGDCIDCNRCVKSCPTGIDIRRGTQLECIACTMCMDACDEIMNKLHRPKGLIRYTNEKELQKDSRTIGIRSYLYASVCIAILIGLISILNIRQGFHIKFLRGSKVPYQKVSETKIANHFKAKINYYGEETFNIDFKVTPADYAGKIEVISPQAPVAISDGNEQIDLFFQFSPKILVEGKLKILLNITNDENVIINTTEVQLVGPYK